MRSSGIGFQQVDGRFAAGVLKEAPDTVRHVDDVVLFVDDDGRRGILLEQPLVEIGRRQPFPRPQLGGALLGVADLSR